MALPKIIRQCPLPPRPPRGVALIYLTVAMVVLIALTSLAVDLGRVYVARGELQLAADAAARYGVLGLPDVATAQRYAIDAADDNRADGSPVVLDPARGDVEVGEWSDVTRGFRTLPPAELWKANAVRVWARRTADRGNAVPLIWAQALGRPTCDVSTSAVAVYVRPNLSGVVGLQSVTLSGSSRIDSYRSALGPYGGANVLDSATITSNGFITTGGSSQIYGGAESALGPAGTLSANAVRTASIPAPLNYPLPSTGGRDGTSGDFSGSSLSAGTYYFRNFFPAAPFTLTGPVVIYVSGNMGPLRNVLTYQNLPANFKLVLTTPATVDIDIDISGNRALYGDIYAPYSDLALGGSADLYGKFVVNSVSLSGNSGIHIDESLLAAAVNPGVKLVK